MCVCKGTLLCLLHQLGSRFGSKTHLRQRGKKEEKKKNCSFFFFPVQSRGPWVRLSWLAHDEASGPYITIPQYRFNKTKQHTEPSAAVQGGHFLCR